MSYKSLHRTFVLLMVMAVGMVAGIVWIIHEYPTVDPEEINEIQTDQMQDNKDIQKNTDAIKRVRKVIGRRAE